MLLNKSNYSANDIVCFKLVNGDEVVAKVVSSVPGGWIINKPCTVMPSPQGIGLIQTLFTADINKDVELRFEHVIMHSVTLKALEDHYLQTTTGIALGKGPIVT